MVQMHFLASGQVFILPGGNSTRAMGRQGQEQNEVAIRFQRGRNVRTPRHLGAMSLVGGLTPAQLQLPSSMAKHRRSVVCGI